MWDERKDSTDPIAKVAPLPAVISAPGAPSAASAKAMAQADRLARRGARLLRRIGRAVLRLVSRRARRRAARGRDYDAVAASGLFDRAWYLDQNPDLRAAGVDPLAHYLEHGAREGRKPNAVFDGAWYLAQNPDVRAAGTNPLVHYLRHGVAEGRAPGPTPSPEEADLALIAASGLFDAAWYLAQNPDVCAAGVDPLLHYLRHGAGEGRAPGPDFDGAWYLERNPDVAAAGVNPLEHYVRHGAREQRATRPLPPGGGLDAGAEALDADFQLVAASGLFDARRYLQRNPDLRDVGMHPLLHYLTRGAAEGRDPHPLFDGAWYLAQNPDVRAAGMNPLVHYLRLGAGEGRNPNPLFDGAWYLAQNPDVRAAGMNPLTHYLFHGAGEGRACGPSFDGGLYLANNPDVAASGIEPLEHFLLYGAKEGRLRAPPPAAAAPPVGGDRSIAFDPVYYRERYPDVARAGLDPLDHYLTAGRSEGRRPTSLAARLTFDRSRLDARRRTVLLLCHEASRSGAPILGWNIAMRLREKYNVIVLLLAAGELIDDFRDCCAAVVGPLTPADREPLEAKYLVARLLDSYSVAYAIANSAESRHFVPALGKAGVPVVSLIHEFSSYTRPKEQLSEALEWSAQIVFSSELTAESAANEHSVLSGRAIHILPQGRCELPGRPQAGSGAQLHSSLDRVFRPSGYEEAFVVLGAGQISIRKGVEAFLACAAALPPSLTQRPVRFVWIGAGYDPANDLGYSTYLFEQIVRSGLLERVSIIPPVEDMAPAYTSADVFFLSSRLDAMPNVAIDAAFSGLPLLCFEKATGMASLLAAFPALRCCVLPYLDVPAAARVIARFAADEDARLKVGEAVRRFAATTFDMAGYVRRLDQLGCEAADIVGNRGRQAR